MIVLDTNVISELRKAKTGRIDKNVETWAESMDSALMFVSSMTLMELDIGILSHERKDPLQGTILRSWFENQVLPEFADRTLPVDTKVALRCARLHVPDKRSEIDALIAATALVHGMTVATRNVADFKPTGVSLINPWEFK